MDHGTADTNSCKISMIWNYHTRDACFLAEGWQIQNDGMMVASCIGVALLVVILEFLRLLGRNLDNKILEQMRRRGNVVLASSAKLSDDVLSNRAAGPSCRPVPVTTGPRRKVVMRVSAVQQLIRAVLYAVTFGIAYLIMLILMSFNAYLFFSVVIGAGLGKFLCDWLSCTVMSNDDEESEKQAEGIEELTVCCQ